MKPFIFGGEATSNSLGLSVIIDLKQPQIVVSPDFPLVCYYGGWTIEQMYERSPRVKNFMHSPYGFPFKGRSEEAGYYALRTAPLQTDLTWDQQLAVPPADDWSLCPSVIATVGTLLVLMETPYSFLEGQFGSCAEKMFSNHRTALTVEKSRVRLCNTDLPEVGFDGRTFPMLQRIECKKIG